MNLQCPQCKIVNAPDAKFCKGCGIAFAVAPIKKNNNLTLVIAIIGGLLFLCVICGKCGSTVSDSAKTAQSQTEQTAPALASTPPPQLKTSAEIVAEAKTALSKTKTSQETIAAAERLSTVPANAKEYKEAQKLIAAYQKQRAAQEATEKKEKAINEKIVAKVVRKAVIAAMEKDLLSKGMDFYFTFEGKEEDILRVKYVLMSRPLIYKITNETEFTQNMQKTGVKKIIFTDGYNETWTFDL